jgi:hypothetical protein
MRRRSVFVALGCLAWAASPALSATATARPNNVVLFVADGLRAGIVNAQTAPNMAALRERGVAFPNSHSLFPTFTTANASAMATGHYLGDTGDFSNTISVGFPVPSAGGSVTPFLENDAVLDEMDRHFAGDYLNETTLLKAAHDAGNSTAIVGKLGPALIWDHTDRAGMRTVVIDDSTGRPGGIPLAPDITEAMKEAGLSLIAPSRGDNGQTGNVTTPGTTSANVAQQAYFVDVVTKVLLPIFITRSKPFVLVFWSLDPDGTQHNEGDSLNNLTPGINGPTSLAAVKNADDNLGKIQATLAALGLADTTNIFVAADHGFSTISKESQTSPAARAYYKDVLPNHLPPGFVALDLAQALHLPVFDPDNKNSQVLAQSHSVRGNGLIGEDPARPDVIVAANGGSDLVYLPSMDRKLATRIVRILMAQDYVSGLFVDDALGRIPGALPLSAINLKGRAVTPTPTIVVNFRTFDSGCGEPLNCGVEVADYALQQGQGMHGSFSRADTFNFMAAIGPDFKRSFADPAPVSNADVGRTLAKILGLKITPRGKLLGRVMGEAMPHGATPPFRARTMLSKPGPGGLVTILNYQQVGGTRYFDAAGFSGRTLGLATPTGAGRRRPHRTFGLQNWSAE